MENKLTKQEKGFVKDYVETGNGTQSVMNNMKVKNENVAGVTATRLLREVKIQDAIKSIADSIPNELLEQVHREGLQASEKFYDRDGNQIEQPDYSVRHKYLDSAYKLKGSYAPDKTINVNVDIESSQEIKDLANKLDELDKKNGTI